MEFRYLKTTLSVIVSVRFESIRTATVEPGEARPKLVQLSRLTNDGRDGRRQRASSRVIIFVDQLRSILHRTLRQHQWLQR